MVELAGATECISL